MRTHTYLKTLIILSHAMSKSYKIFAAEDDPAFSRMLRYVLELDPEHEVKMFDTGRKLIDALHEGPQLVTIDYSLPDMSGEELLKRVKFHDSQMGAIIISGQEDIKTAVKLLKLGAFDYITKDKEASDRLVNAINNIKKNQSLVSEIETLREEVGQKYDFNKVIIGNSPTIKKVFTLMEKAAAANITASITGETGTGKELVAKSIHYHSPRSKQPFVPVNVAAIPSELIESELFGHEKGSFTGAVARRIGKFEEANKGTLFLDEIGEMPLSMQAKLLRVLQEREVVRIGGNQNVKLDVRLIVATHRNLAEEVEAGRFRQDLYYRLLGLSVHLPPLRNRGEDVVLIAKHFLTDFCKQNQMPVPKISKEAVKKLLAYSYPGNIRELKAIAELAAVMSTGEETISEEHIIFNQLGRKKNLLSEETTLQEHIYDIVNHYLEKYDNNVLLVAKKLDIGKSTIYRYLKDMKEPGR